MTLVDVLVELDDGTETTCLAKIEEERSDSYVVRYMSPTKKYCGDQKIYVYENTTYTIDKSCVSGFYDSTKEEDAGWQKVEGGWISNESDSDYIPSGSDETDTDTDTSLTASESEED
jgi:hypothetical protein